MLSHGKNDEIITEEYASRLYQPLKEKGFNIFWRSEVDHGHDFKVPTAQLAAHFFGQFME